MKNKTIYCVKFIVLDYDRTDYYLLEKRKRIDIEEKYFDNINTYGCCTLNVSYNFVKYEQLLVDVYYDGEYKSYLQRFLSKIVAEIKSDIIDTKIKKLI